MVLFYSNFIHNLKKQARNNTFLECIEKAKEVWYNKLSDLCNLVKGMQTEEI